MPFVRVDVTSAVTADVRRRLLSATAALFAEITESPLDRVRSQVRVVDPDDFAVGGAPISESGVEAPFVSVDLLAGRPPEQHRALIERLSALVSDIVAVPIERVRMRITEVPPHDWGIGGVPAAELRQAEIDARAGWPGSGGD
jgi:4-oxalocrotonate tautomerase family enzyme